MYVTLEARTKRLISSTISENMYRILDLRLF